MDPALDAADHGIRLAKDYEQLPETIARLHFAAFASLMLQQIAFQASTSP